MSSAQVGKSECVLNLIGYYADQDPAPMLVLQPTLEMAEAFSKDRVSPMVRDTPVLRGKFPQPRAKSGGGTLLHKKFPGGHLTLAGANSPASLASRPVRVVLADEVDRYPASAGGEGDPVDLAFKRTSAFWNARHGMFSTPTDAETSRIAKAFEDSDQRFYLVPCPHCHEPFRLVWDLVKWDTLDDGAYSPDVWVVCPNCGSRVNESDKGRMLAHGVWTASMPFTGIAGFHLSELYSPWRTWRQVRDAFHRAKGSPERLRTWVNTSLGEVWQQDEETIDTDAIGNRREPYTDLPPAALVLTAGVDVQDDRLEVEILAWGEDYENWGTEYRVLSGDPGKPELWNRLADLLQETWLRTDGVQLHVSAMGVDSGGHYTTQVYDFVRRYPGRVFALKGMAGTGRPLVDRPRRTNKGKVPLFTVGVDMVKELFFFSQLRTTAPGPGYCHFPADYQDEWFKQLGNEKAVIRHKAGIPGRVWIATGRNEAIDCRVYGIAAINILRPNFTAIARRLAPEDVRPGVLTKPAQPGKAKEPYLSRRRGYLRD